MAGKRNLRQRVASLLELPGDVMLDEVRITLVGTMELVVENHRGLVEFEPERVVLQVPNRQLAISGDRLAIASISPDQVVIHGQILALRYSDDKGGR